MIMIDTLFGKITKLAYHTTKTGRAYIKFCVTEERKTMDDKFGKEWYHCTYWNTKDGLYDGQFALVYGHNVKNPDKNDPNKIFNNFDVKHIEITTETSKNNLNITTQESQYSPQQDYAPFSNNTNLDDVPF